MDHGFLSQPVGLDTYLRCRNPSLATEMLSHRHWTTFVLLLFFTIACQGYNYGNDTIVEIFNARDLEARSGTDGDVHKLRIVAVGDVHGDYERFLTILRYLEVVDQHDKWSGKVDVFVQLGDVMDR